jgi:hypothetical protein
MKDEYYNIPARKGSKIAELLDFILRADNAKTIRGICLVVQRYDGGHGAFGANHAGQFNMEALLKEMNIVSKGKPEVLSFHKPTVEIKA